MIFEQFYLECLSHASYLVGDTTMKWLIGISLTYGIGILGCAVGVLAVAIQQ